MTKKRQKTKAEVEVENIRKPGRTRQKRAETGRNGQKPERTNRSWQKEKK